MHCQHVLFQLCITWEALGSLWVQSDAWLHQECLNTSCVGSSLGGCSRNSARWYICLKWEVRLTTCIPLQWCRMGSYQYGSCSWSSSSDQICELSAVTWKLSDEQVCSFATASVHGTKWCGKTWLVVMLDNHPGDPLWRDRILRHTYCSYSAEYNISCWCTAGFFLSGCDVDAGHVLADLDLLQIKFVLIQWHSTVSAVANSCLLPAIRKWINLKCSASDFKWWTS